MKWSTSIAIISIALFTVLSSCATGSGSTFQGVADATAPESTQESSSVTESEERSDDGRPDRNPSDGPRNSTTTREEIESTASRLEVRSTPSGASVYLNDSFVGTTPLTLSELEPGSYRIALRADGYYEHVRWVDLRQAESVAVSAQLSPVTGYLSVISSPSDVLLSVDGRERSELNLELPVGVHTIRVRKFGYQEYKRSVRIRENVTTRLELTLEKAPFRIEEITPSRRVVNPNNPGRLGMLDVRFEVSAPGSGRMVVTNSAEAVVFQEDLGPFTTWQQSVRWDPVDRSGQSLPEGRYEIRISGEGDGRQDHAVAAVTVSNAARIRYRSTWSGLSGALYSPTPELLPQDSLQLSLTAAGHRGSVAGGGDLVRVPTHVGFRLPIAGRGELTVTGAAYLFNDTTRNRLQGSAGVKWQLSDGSQLAGFQSALSVRGTAHGPVASGSLAAPDTLTDYAGISLGAPLLFGGQRLSITAMPELHFAPAPVSYADNGGSADSWLLWSYLRGGILFDYGRLSAALSAALRSKPFSREYGIDLPFAVGAEVHWLIPDTLVELSFISAAEISARDDYYVLAGGGLGFIY